MNGPFVREGDELLIAPNYSGAFHLLRLARGRYLHDERGLPTAPATLVEDPLDRLESEYAADRVGERIDEAQDTTDSLVDEIVQNLVAGDTVALDADGVDALFAWLNTLYVAARATEHEAVEVGKEAGLFDDEDTPDFGPVAGLSAALLTELLNFID